MKVTIQELLRFIEMASWLRSTRQTLIIGVDGCGGSGKSTLASELQKLHPERITVVHMDDFYRPSAEHTDAIRERYGAIGANFDWPRVREQVLEPLSREEEGKYQQYDWDQDSLVDWHSVPVGGIVIVEGVCATRLELTDFYDLTIWVECPYSIRLARGIERDGERARNQWVNVWMPAEEQYAKEHEPMRRADLVIDGTGAKADLADGIVELLRPEV